MKEPALKEEKKYLRQDVIDLADEVADDFIKIKFSNGYRDHFFPHMINSFGYEVGAEIGTDKGDFANHLMSKSNLQTIFCVDAWLDNFGSKYQQNNKQLPITYDPDGSVRFQQAYETLQAFSPTFAENVTPDYISSVIENITPNQTAHLIKDYSVPASQKFPSNVLDFVYIDGDHSLDGIYQDLYCWVPKVKLGGIVAGHDYKDGGDSGMPDYFGNQLPYAVKAVVDSFCLKYGFKLNVAGGVIKSWWFIKNKEVTE